MFDYLIATDESGLEGHDRDTVEEVAEEAAEGSGPTRPSCVLPFRIFSSPLLQSSLPNPPPKRPSKASRPPKSLLPSPRSASARRRTSSPLRLSTASPAVSTLSTSPASSTSTSPSPRAPTRTASAVPLAQAALERPCRSSSLASCGGRRRRTISVCRPRGGTRACGRGSIETRRPKEARSRSTSSIWRRSRGSGTVWRTDCGRSRRLLCGRRESRRSRTRSSTLRSSRCVLPTPLLHTF